MTIIDIHLIVLARYLLAVFVPSSCDLTCTVMRADH